MSGTGPLHLGRRLLLRRGALHDLHVSQGIFGFPGLLPRMPGSCRDISQQILNTAQVPPTRRKPGPCAGIMETEAILSQPATAPTALRLPSNRKHHIPGPLTSDGATCPFSGEPFDLIFCRRCDDIYLISPQGGPGAAFFAITASSGYLYQALRKP